MKIMKWKDKIQIGDKVRVKTFREVVENTNSDLISREFFQNHAGLEGEVVDITRGSLHVDLECHTHEPGYMVNRDDIHKIGRKSVERV